MNLQTENINRAIEAAKMLVVRLENLKKLEQNHYNFEPFKKAARADLAILNYNLQTVL